MNLVEWTEYYQQRHWMMTLWKKLIIYFIHWNNPGHLKITNCTSNKGDVWCHLFHKSWSSVVPSRMTVGY